MADYPIKWSGSSFKDGKLYFFSPDFRAENGTVVYDPLNGIITVCAATPRFQAWQKQLVNGTGAWRAHLPSLPLESLLYGAKTAEELMSKTELTSSEKIILKDAWAKKSFLDTIPRHIWQPVHDLFNDQHWRCMRTLAATGEAGIELARSNPALFYAIANYSAFHHVTQPLRSARRAVFRKRRDICARLGFPATDTVERILKKLDLKAVRLHYLLYLRKLMTRPQKEWQVLSHLETIMPCVVRLVTIPERRQRLSDSFLVTYSHSNELRENMPDMDRLLDLAISLAREAEIAVPAKFDHPRQLMEFYQIVSNKREYADGRERSSRSARYAESLVQFSEGPLLEQEWLKQLRNPFDLNLEGKQMHNCVASYSHHLKKGDRFLYSIKLPEGRATMEVSLKAGMVNITGLLGVRNQRVPELARKVIDSLPVAIREGFPKWIWCDQIRDYFPEVLIDNHYQQLQFDFAAEPKALQRCVRDSN